jgi:Flp pilus assembly protein TadG
MTIFMGGLMLVAAFIVGGVVDYMSLSNQKHALHGVADRAALAAAQELIVFKGSDKRVDSVAQSFVTVNYTAKPTKATARIIDEGKAVEVTIVAEPQTYFPGPVARGVTEIKVSAVAEISGGGYVCMIGLSTSEPSTLEMHDKARVTAEACAIYSNSRSPSSLRLHNSARGEGRSRLRCGRRTGKHISRFAKCADRGLPAAGRSAARQAGAQRRPAGMQQHPGVRKHPGQRSSRQGRQAAVA